MAGTTIASTLADHDQSQLLTPPPPPEKQEDFLAKLQALDYPKLKSTFETSLSQSGESRNLAPFKDVTELASLSAETAAGYRADGLTNIAQGKTCALLLAGGQGTRLGSSSPKGCYNIGMPSNKPLFQYYCERITAVKRLAAAHAGVDEATVRLPFVIMCSHATSAALYPAWDLWHGGDFYEATPDGEIVWRHEDILHHHDGQWLKNGNLLYTVAAPLPADKAARVCGGDPRKDGADGVVQSDIVKEVNRKGETVWEWRIWDHIDPADLPIHPIFDRRHWPMINGVSETRDGLVLMSLRTTSGVIAVEKATGRIVWHAGPDVVFQQHTPVEMDDGSILVFDNGNLRPGSSNPYSRAIQFDPKIMQTTWDYTDPNAPSFFSPFMGSAQRLGNGNTLICESAFGRLFEVTPAGEVVWEYVIPEFAEYPAPLNQFIRGAHNTCFRAHRYAESQVPWL